MNNFQLFFTVALSIIAVIILPAVGMLVRITMKWTRVEDKLDHVIKNMEILVLDKDRVHQELSKQMADDRRATDRRLRWLEENVWNRGKSS